MRAILMLIVGASLSLALGCGQATSPEELATTAIQEEPTPVEAQTVQADPTATPGVTKEPVKSLPVEAVQPEPTATPEIQKVLALPVETLGAPLLDSYGAWGVASLEEMIADSSVIVRGTFNSVRPVGVKFPSEHLFYDGSYVGSLEFTFDVLEYLLGTDQGNTIAGVAYGATLYDGPEDYKASTAAQATELARSLLEYRDTRWDDREAIIFLSPVSGRTYLSLGMIGPNLFKITIADAERKRWLPNASAPAASSTSGGRSTSSTSSGSKAAGKYFLTDEPSGSRRGRATGQPALPNISLTDLKAKVATVEAKVADGGGSEAYRECLSYTYNFNRIYQFSYRLTSGTIESGLPAGTRALTYEKAIEIHQGLEKPSDFDNRFWREGPDAHLMGQEYPGYVTILRPLPAGEYVSFLLRRDAEMDICDGYPEGYRGKVEDRITVTAPAGTLREAFFDPVADGTATTATTTVGTIRYEANTVKATLTPTVTDHILDFIALDGSVLLSLDASDATTTDDVLSWTVGSAPWSTGDKLMLRIRQPVASVTVTLSPHVEGISTHGFIVIEWVDPAQCDSRYFVGLYSGETARRVYGFHPAPETTSYSANTRLHWDRIPDSDWTARVTCAPSDGSGWNVVAETPIVSGLPASGS